MLLYICVKCIVQLLSLETACGKRAFIHARMNLLIVRGHVAVIMSAALFRLRDADRGFELDSVKVCDESLCSKVK